MHERSALRCDLCGAAISTLEIEEGRAMVVLGKNYCPNCLSQAIKRARDPEQPPESDSPPSPPLERRRHERKDTALSLEVTLYDASGGISDRGTALMRNISLSGALLTGILLGRATISSATRRIGIRVLEGDLRAFEILGRVVRREGSGMGGMSVALEFDRTERVKVERVSKIV